MKRISLSELPAEFVSHNPEIQKKVMLRSGELPHLTNFSQARLAPDQVASSHHHTEMYEVFFVEAGEGIIHINDTPHILKPGVCVAVEPGERHEVSNTGTEELVLTYFGLLT